MTSSPVFKKNICLTRDHALAFDSEQKGLNPQSQTTTSQGFGFSD